MCKNKKLTSSVQRILTAIGDKGKAYNLFYANRAKEWGNMPTNSSIPTANKQQTLWTESASELYRPSDRRLSAKLVPL
jgi:hypothetical protein